MATSQACADERSAPDGGGSARLLIVDDDPAAIMALGRLLAAQGQVSFATGGADALALVQAQRPDLILLDTEMPGMSGYDVCRELKADPATAAIPVIFATSHDSPEVQAAVLALGAADFFSKPMVPAVVQARVRAQLRQQARPGGASPKSPRPGEWPAVAGALQLGLLTAGRSPAAARLSAVGDVDLLSGASFERAPRVQHDVVVIDGSATGIDALGLCAQARALPRWRDVLLAVLRPTDRLDLEARALDLGADEVLAADAPTTVWQARLGRLVAQRRRAEATLQAAQARWEQIGDRRVADLVASASDGIVSVDAGQRLVLVNEAAGRLFGLPAAQAMGRPLTDFLPECLGGVERVGVAGQATVRHVDGSSSRCDVAMSSSGEGSERVVTLVMRDRTERDRREVVERQRAEAEAALRAKRTMIAFIAHEIGNPVHAICGFTELALSDEDEPLPPEQRRRVQLIEDSARQLEALMQDVADLTRLETGAFTVAPTAVDVAATVREAGAMLAPEWARNRQRLVFEIADDLPRAWADARRLRQCVLNLLSNAAKYGRPGGAVTVRARPQDGQVCIEVRDDGIGMTAQQLEHLFEPFNRLGRERGSVRGIGLGLSLTRQLAQVMGGSLRASSEAGVGSTFCLTLPAEGATAGA